MSNQFVKFLTDLGFNEPRQTANKDIIELVVRDTLKTALKKLRSGRVKFMLLDKTTTTNGTVQEFYAVQDRTTVGRVKIESFATHSVIQLTNLGE